MVMYSTILYNKLFEIKLIVYAIYQLPSYNFNEFLSNKEDFGTERDRCIIVTKANIDLWRTFQIYNSTIPNIQTSNQNSISLFGYKIAI